MITTAHLISMTMLKLLDDPSRLAAVPQDHSLIPAVIEETLRMESPVQWAPRRVVKDTVVGGVLIPRGPAC